MQQLTFTSCMAPNSDATSEKICAYVGQKLGIETTFLHEVPWQERERLFDAGQIQVCWICGLPYVWKADQQGTQIELLAAPVMAGERYQGQPVYFSDVVVRQDSRFYDFNSLHGGSWAYNEPHSHSGYNVTRYYLAQKQLSGSFFGRVIAAGSHENALQMVLRGDVDASAIDSTVLQTELLRVPAINMQLRCIETFGPSPIPPWIIRKEVPAALRQAVRAVLCTMHEDDAGRRILANGRIRQFIAVPDTAYDPIREMDTIAQQVQLSPTV
jgi:phosphonate transport system substrate-binding protein